MNTDDFKLQIGLDLSTNTATKQLQEFKRKVEKTIKINVDGEEELHSIVTYVNKLGQSFRTAKVEMQDANGTLVNLQEKIISTSSNFEKLSATEKRVTTVTKNLFNNLSGERLTEVSKSVQMSDGSFQKIITRTKEWIDDNGRLNTSIQNLKQNSSGVYEQIGATVNTVTDRISNISTVVGESKEIINGYVANVKTVTKNITNTSGAVETVIEKTKTWTDSNNMLHTSIETVNAKGQQLKPTIESVQKAEDNATSSSNQLSNANKKVSQSFTEVMGKVAKFYLASLPIRAVQTAITDTITTVKEFDEAFTELAKVASSNTEQLKKYVSVLGEMGTDVGRTITEMTEATTGWVKAGYNEEDASKLAKYTALLQNTADEELSASEATSILVSQLKAYNMEVDDTIKITDILNAVSAQQAVSSGDLAKGLTQASASMSTYNNDIYETTALLTAGTTIFQGKSQQVKSCCLLNIA